MSLRLTIIIMFISICTAAAGEIPKAVWRPGNFLYPSALRLTEDGRFATMLSQSGVTVVDLRTGFCALTQVFQYRKPPFGQASGDVECIGAVSNSGNELCVLHLLDDRLYWYHIGDSIPWNVQTVEDREVTTMQFVADTVLVLTTAQDSSGVNNIRVSPTAITLTPLKQDSRDLRWLNDSTVAIDGHKDGLPIATIVDVTSGDTLLMFPGYCLGIDSSGRILAFCHTVQLDIVALDAKTGVVLEVIVESTGQNAPLVRSRFVETHEGLLDIRTRRVLKQLKPFGRPYDILSDRTHIYLPYAGGEMHIWWRDAELQSIELFRGPVTCVVQDPRDSVMYALTRGAYSNMEQGPDRQVVRIEGELAIGYNGIGSQQTISNSIDLLSPFRQIDNVWVSEFRGGGLEHFRGFIEFASPDADSIGIKTCIPYYDYYPAASNRQYYFSERGDTLMIDDGTIQTSSCSRKRRREPAEYGVSGFLPTTSYYIVRNVRYSLTDCTDSLILPFYLNSISTKTDLLFAYDHGRFLLTSGSDIRQHLASVDMVSMKESWWADSGRTIRFSSGSRTTLVSLQADGRVHICALPAPFSRDAAQWFPSHNGRVLTCRTGDTVVSIDVLTSQILREYNGATWLYRSYPYESNPFGKNCQVSDVDGRLIVSQPNGCVATFPGIALPLMSAVENTPSPLRPLTLVGTRIVGAVEQSVVTVYSLLGSVVLQAHTDDSGSIDLSEKGLPHGAYVATFETASGVRTGRILL